jgi:hypothetical protein
MKKTTLLSIIGILFAFLFVGCAIKNNDKASVVTNETVSVVNTEKEISNTSQTKFDLKCLRGPWFFSTLFYSRRFGKMEKLL